MPFDLFCPEDIGSSERRFMHVPRARIGRIALFICVVIAFASQQAEAAQPQMARCEAAFDRAANDVSFPATELYLVTCSGMVLHQLQAAVGEPHADDFALLSRAIQFAQGQPGWGDDALRGLLKVRRQLAQDAIYRHGAECRRLLKEHDYKKAARELRLLHGKVDGLDDPALKRRVESLDWSLERSRIQGDLDAVSDLIFWRDKSAPMAKAVLVHAGKVWAKAKDAIAQERQRTPPETKAIRRTRESELKGLVWHLGKLERRLITVETDHALRRALEALERKEPRALSDRLQQATALLESPRSALMLKRKRGNFAWRIRRLESRLKRAQLNAQWTKEWHDARKPKQGALSESGISMRCTLPSTLGLFVSPERPSAERPLQIIAVSAPQHGALELTVFGPLDNLDRIPDSPPKLSLTPLVGPRGKVDAWVGAHTPTERGLWRVVAYREGREVGCINVSVDPARNRLQRRGYRLKRPSIRSWGPQEELLYTSWVHHLFDEAEGKTWPALDAVTRNPERNFLHNHLQLGEDNVDLVTQRRARLKRLAAAVEGEVRAPEVRHPPGLVLRPDCADLVVFLRAYFAWKLGLPSQNSCALSGESCEPIANPASMAMR